MKLKNPGYRATEEWVGRDADTPVPAAVKLRVFRRYGGRCYLSGRKITPADKWDAEHVKPIWRGGENRETNLRPALVDAHKEKTANEAGERAKCDRIAMKHAGIFPETKFKLQGRGFQKRWNP